LHRIAVTAALCLLSTACSERRAGEPKPSSQDGQLTTASVRALPSAPPGPADPGSCPPLQPGSPLADPNLVDQFVWNALPDLPDGTSLTKARALGQITAERVRRLDNEYDPGQQIEERTLVYAGLEVTGQVTPDQTLRLWHAKITKPGWKVRDGLGVGASVEELARVLGCANRRAGDVLTYSGETESVQFTIRDGRIAAVELFHYHE
jgi:hypothetical protein